MLGTPTSNPAPRGSVLRREKGRAMRDQDNFDRTLNAGEVVHFMLSTPRASDMKAGGHGDTGRMGTVRHQLHDAALEMGQREALPTPTKRDKRMDAGSPAYDKRKSPTMDAVVDGAMTNRAPDKWQYARQIADVLKQANLSGASQTLPVVYGFMMAYPPAWLERALLSAVQEGLLPPVSSSKRMETL